MVVGQASVNSSRMGPPMGPVEGLFTVSKKNRGCRGARIINRIYHNTSDSLKAYLVAPFANMPREEITLAWPTTTLESSTSPRKRVASSFFAFILFYILISSNKKNQADNFIFKCVRETLFEPIYRDNPVYFINLPVDFDFFLRNGFWSN